MIVSTKIANMFKEVGFVNVDYLVKNQLERNPSKILNILNRDWRKWVKPVCMPPVRMLDPDFGYKTAGASYTGQGSYLMTYPYVCPEVGVAISITFYSSAVQYYYRHFILYGATNRVEYTTEDSAGWSLSWKTLNAVLGASLAPQTYYMGWFAEVPMEYASFYYDVDAAQYNWFQNVTYCYPPPATWTKYQSSNSRKFSVYCTYVTAGGGIKAQVL